MSGVVALLDEEHTQRIQALWAELERDFGVRVVNQTIPWPHITCQGAERYDLERVETTLREIAGQTAPFTVHAEGIGVFSGPQPMLYLPVARDAALNRLHTRLWEALAPASEQVAPDYSPDHWIAHITLAMWDISAATLGAIVARLAERLINWWIDVSALGLITGTGSGTGANYDLRSTHALRGSAMTP